MRFLVEAAAPFGDGFGFGIARLMSDCVRLFEPCEVCHSDGFKGELFHPAETDEGRFPREPL